MRKVLLATAMLAALPGAGCTMSEERAGGGAVLGAATGSVIGALATGRPGGALAGAALGGATGAIVGAATTPSYGRPAGPVIVERVRERPVYVEEEVDMAASAGRALIASLILGAMSRPGEPGCADERRGTPLGLNLDRLSSCSTCPGRPSAKTPRESALSGSETA